MQHALYAPGMGYYSAGSIKFGQQGDFVTAPELGSLFAQCVAIQCAEIFSKTQGPYSILEVGAGSGQLACDLLNVLADKDVKIEQYLILELSADLKQRQQAKIQQQLPEFFNKIVWLDQLPSQPINGVIIANEVLDAMPCNLFHKENNKYQEYYVTCDAKQNLILKLHEPSMLLQQGLLANNIDEYLHQTSHAYTTEINLWISAWIKGMAQALRHGAILLFDYGFARAEYYHPQRNQGTLMCHYQHHSHADPFANLGLQDITAHVDFTAIAEAAISADLEVGGYTNLASFLLNCGLTNISLNNIRQTQEFNILTSAAEMGELFKVMILLKHSGSDPVGFGHYDKSHTL